MNTLGLKAPSLQVGDSTAPQFVTARAPEGEEGTVGFVARPKVGFTGGCAGTKPTGKDRA